jgi:glutamate-5-semialdehyde dehydrogenase
MADLKKKLTHLSEEARAASRSLMELTSKKKTLILNAVSKEMERSRNFIIHENQKDLKTARRMNLSNAMIDRLTLNSKRVKMMAHAVREVAKLSDPVGRLSQQWKRPNGLIISKVTVPLGLILIIYESRPNVTSECASLCLKSGNAVLLRGGREAFYSNRAIVRVYTKMLHRFRLPKAAVSQVTVLDRRGIDVLLKMDHLIQLVIPRGGEALIRRVVKNSRIPVVKHDKGICHVYIDKDASPKMALDISVNSKCQRTGVCNAMETLLIHKAIAPQLIKLLAERFIQAGCEIRGDKTVLRYLPEIRKATEKDWSTEYLDNILSIRVVDNINQAIKHIEKYGSHHTDAIVTNNRKAQHQFIAQVDSSSVMTNASTRFSDGNEYGFGAEIGISTDKIHARGPMGLDGLVSYKYIVCGKGQIRK